MRATKIERFVKAFEKNFPKAWYRVGDFYGDGRERFWTGEDAYDNDGVPLFDYWLQYGSEEEINPKLAELADDFGYFFEANDAGTIVMFNK